MQSSDSVNKFLDHIKQNLAEQQQAPPAPLPPSLVVINRAVRCTIVVGQVPDSKSPSAGLPQQQRP